jgi:hypothetical protein
MWFVMRIEATDDLWCQLYLTMLLDCALTWQFLSLEYVLAVMRTCADTFEYIYVYSHWRSRLAYLQSRRYR